MQPVLDVVRCILFNALFPTVERMNLPDTLKRWPPETIDDVPNAELNAHVRRLREFLGLRPSDNGSINLNCSNAYKRAWYQGNYPQVRVVYSFQP